jgi:4-alpha-glucanotransferase
VDPATPSAAARSSGLLLHPTSLPGPYGIGELGDDAIGFVDAAAAMRQSWWQMLPIGPTGYGDSPYQSPSTFAGNPLLVSVGWLAAEGLLDPSSLVDVPPFPTDHVDFGWVIPWRMEALGRVAAEFSTRAPAGLADELAGYVARHAGWLDDFALFTALKRAYHLRPWWEWDEAHALGHRPALEEAARALAPQVEQVRVEQFLFDRHFAAVRAHALERGIRLIGDIPIFVAHDSADVWAHRHLFYLDERGMPTVVAGVPPDYFSETGQRWGNPLYDWDRHAADGFTWWKARLRRMFELFDLVRVDHFRGFCASWHIPADEPTAVDGRWVEGPGELLFDSLLAEFGTLPVIAEDLGVITPDVEALRDRYGFPGMKILQFGFGTESAHALDRFRPNVVAYTGTHDNDTAVGWYADPRPDRVPERRRALADLHTSGRSFHWAMIRGVMGSVADTAVIPVQDLLGLGSDARMNTPATTAGNWRWRFTWNQITPDVVRRMRTLTEKSGRG